MCKRDKHTGKAWSLSNMFLLPFVAVVSLITPLLPLMVAKVLWDDDHDYNTVQLDKSRVFVGVY